MSLHVPKAPRFISRTAPVWVKCVAAAGGEWPLPQGLPPTAFPALEAAPGLPSTGLSSGFHSCCIIMWMILVAPATQDCIITCLIGAVDKPSSHLWWNSFCLVFLFHRYFSLFQPWSFKSCTLLCEKNTQQPSNKCKCIFALWKALCHTISVWNKSVKHEWQRYCSFHQTEAGGGLDSKSVLNFNRQILSYSYIFTMSAYEYFPFYIWKYWHKIAYLMSCED